MHTRLVSARRPAGMAEHQNSICHLNAKDEDAEENKRPYARNYINLNQWVVLDSFSWGKKRRFTLRALHIKGHGLPVLAGSGWPLQRHRKPIMYSQYASLPLLGCPRLGSEQRATPALQRQQCAFTRTYVAIRHVKSCETAESYRQDDLKGAGKSSFGQKSYVAIL